MKPNRAKHLIYFEYIYYINLFLHIVEKWPNILAVFTPQDFKVCLTIFQHYASKGYYSNYIGSIEHVIPPRARLEVEEGGRKITPRLKLVRILLETGNLVRKFTHICSFRKHTFQYQGLLNFADVSIFFRKKSAFCGKNGTFTQSNSVRVVQKKF